MKLTSSAIAFIAALLLTTSCHAQSGNSLAPAVFETAIAKDTLQILDVRTPVEYESGHIKGALLADWNNEAEYKRRIAFIDKSKPVYVYCLAGGRSAAAATQMRENGFKEVYELSGGINAWKAANKPLEGKSSEPQMSAGAFNSIIKTGTVLVDFGAVWCPPCRKMEPVLQSLKSNYNGQLNVVKVDAGKDLDLLKSYNVTALPVFILFKDGKQVWRKDGVAAEAEIAAQLK